MKPLFVERLNQSPPRGDRSFAAASNSKGCLVVNNVFDCHAAGRSAFARTRYTAR